MLDLKRCPKCGNETSLGNDTCPYCGYRFSSEAIKTQAPASVKESRCPACGTAVSPQRSVCPTCGKVLKKSRASLFALVTIVGLLIVAAIAAIYVFHITPPPPQVANISSVPALTAAPTMPTCTIALAGKKLPTGSIQLDLMELTCGPQDVTTLRVLVNGKQVGTLAYSLGASGTYPAEHGSDTVEVVAHFSSGAEEVVFESTYP